MAPPKATTKSTDGSAKSTDDFAKKSTDGSTAKSTDDSTKATKSTDGSPTKSTDDSVKSTDSATTKSTDGSTSKSTDGSATPRQPPISPTVTAQSPMVENLESWGSSISRLETELQALNSHSGTIDSPLRTDTNKEAGSLRQELDRYKVEHSSLIEQLKESVREDYPQRITKELSSDIQDHIKKEIQANVTTHLDTQFKSLMTVSLKQQLEETNAYLNLAKTSLLNSDHRRHNSTIDISSGIDEPLKVIYKPDGKTSDFWPVDLNSLFAYDSEAIKKLLNDYKLPLDKVQEMNINRFMGHIGVKQQLII